MTVVLQGKFATAEDTAAVLGVPKSRLRRLLRILGLSPESATPAAFRRGSNDAGRAGREGKVARSSRTRKHTRGKGKKVAR